MGLTLLPRSAPGFSGTAHVGELNTGIMFTSLTPRHGTGCIPRDRHHMSILRSCTFHGSFSFSSSPRSQLATCLLAHFSCKSQTQRGVRSGAGSEALLHSRAEDVSELQTNTCPSATPQSQDRIPWQTIKKKDSKPHKGHKK